MNQKQSVQSSSKSARKRWPWVMLGTGLVMGGVAAFAPTLLGDQLISRFGQPAGLTKGKLSGPIWAPKLSNSVLNIPGVKAKAGEVGVQFTGVNPLTKTVRLKLKLHDMVTSIDLPELLKNQTHTQPTGENWKVVIDGVDVEKAQLKLDGQALSLPKLDVQFSSPSEQELEVKGTVGDGPFSSHLKLGSHQQGQTVIADFNADARILRSFWDGVEEGQLSGHYEIGQGPLKGDIQVKDMLLRVPDAEFTEIKGVGGQLIHRGDQIDLKLAGEAWDGPVTAKGQANLAKQQWTATASAQPKLSGLGEALNTNGQGDLTLDVTASGWTDFEAKAQIQSEEGTLGGLPFTQLKADYFYEKTAEQEQPKQNQLTWKANTQLSGAQTLTGNWQLGQQGRMDWKGQFANAPIHLKADIDAQNIMALSGNLLGGPMQAQFNPKDLGISGTLNPKLSGVQAKLELSGQVSDLTAQISEGQAGPFPLEGTVWYNEQGLKADLQGLQLDLNKNLVGTWQAKDFVGSGISLTGQGQLDLAETKLEGQLQTQLPGLDDPLQGPISLNMAELQGQYLAGQQRLLWKNDQIDLSLRDLTAQGAKLNGDLQLSTRSAKLDVRGQLSAKGNGYDLRLHGLGQRADLQGSVSGVGIQGQTQFQAPFQSQLKLDGTDVQAKVSVQDGVRFSVLTRDQNGQQGQAQGVLNGADLDATGRIYLAALQPLVPTLAPSGTLDLNLAGQRGHAKLTASVKTGEQQAKVISTLTRRATGQGLGALDTQLEAQTVLNGETAKVQLSGEVFPRMQLRGPVQWMEQKLNAQLTGEYHNLSARVWGRTQALTFQGVSLPAQTLNIQGDITPKAQLAGTWGDLNLSFNANTGRLLVQGQQELTAAGRTGTIETRAEWGSDFQGRIQAKGRLDDYQLQLDGPWRNVQLTLTNPQGLRGQGVVSVPDATYDMAIKGPVPLQGQTLHVDGLIRGQGAKPKVNFFVADGLGGRGTLKLSNLENIDFSAQSLKIAGYRLDGTLSNQDGQLNGRATLGPLDVIAQNGQVRATGTLAGQEIKASAQVELPAQLSDIHLRVNGPYAQIRADGSMQRLTGQVQLKEQHYGSEQAQVRIPAQTYPLLARLQGAPQLSVGNLKYNRGQWQGALTTHYTLHSAQPNGSRQTQAGQLNLLGQADILSLKPSGAVTGQVQVLPHLSGTVSGKLAAFSGLLPENLRQNLRPGQIVAQIHPTGADLSLQRTQYLNQPLGLQAKVTWQDGVQAKGALTHPGTRLPVEYDGQDLRVKQGRLDARMLSPMLPEASGILKVNLEVPQLDFAQANGRADVDLQATNLKAKGQMNLQAGQLSADLLSTLPNQDGPLELQGKLYPAADARLKLGDLNGTLRGHADRQLVLHTKGQYQGREVDLTATANQITQQDGQLQMTGLVAGAKLDVHTKRSTSNPQDWPTKGTVNIADLKPLTGTAGQVQAVLGGTLSNLALTASGQAAGMSFTAPARFKDNQLQLSKAKFQMPQGQVEASGQVFPALALQASAKFQEGLPGQFNAQIGGSYNKPDVRAKGVLSESKTGLQAAGTPVQIRLLGKDWKAQFDGPAIRGQVRGQLGLNAAGGLLSSQLQLDTAYLSDKQHIKIRGKNAWNAKQGWAGHLNISGDTTNGPLYTHLVGAGDLKLDGLIGSGSRIASFDGTLAADFPIKPGGKINMTRLDAGAFWQRPGELTATGTAQLAGTAWNKLEASFNGQIKDRGEELSGQLSAEYRAGNGQLKLTGQKVSGSAFLQDGRYQANFKAQQLDAARLLPPNMNVTALHLAGRLNARGSLEDGPERLAGEQLAIKGEMAQLGPFSLYGGAEYQPAKDSSQTDVLKADLWGSLRGGLIKAQGNLSENLSLHLSDIAAHYGEHAPLGKGKLGGEFKLGGQLSNPNIQGSLTALTDRLDAKLMLNGTSRRPQAHARIHLRGNTRGTLHADFRNPDWQAGTLQTQVYGTVESNQNRAQIDLAGTWPKLRGELVAQVPQLEAPFKLTADGSGQFALQNGQHQLGQVTLAAGTGWLPKLSGQLDFNALDLLPAAQKESAKGQAEVQAQLSGSLSAPQLSGQLNMANLQVSGVKVPASTGSFQFGDGGLTGLITQNEKQVATFDAAGAKIQGFSFQAAGSQMSATGTLSLQGRADLAMQSKGMIESNIQAQYLHQNLKLSGDIKTQGLETKIKVSRNPLTGWNGQATVSGGPQGILTHPLNLKLRGSAENPLLTGEGGLLGAGARLVANSKMVQLRLIDGDEAKAKGVLELRPNQQGKWNWSGKAQIKRPELNVQVEPSGPVADPRVIMNLRQGEWNASGTASLQDTKLELTDGLQQGHLRWDGQRLFTNIPRFDLARLGFKDVQGQLNAQGQVSKEGTGQLKIAMIGLSVPREIPTLGLPLQGNADTTVDLKDGRASLTGTADLPSGEVEFQVRQAAESGQWLGKLTGTLKRLEGQLHFDVHATPKGLEGKAKVSNYPIDVAGRELVLDGQADLSGQVISTQLSGKLGTGTAEITAEGGLANLAPVLSGPFPLQPTEDGYDLRARLNDIDLKDVGIMPALEGTINGQANISDGGGTFFLESNQLKLGSAKTVKARMEGTQVAGDWRLKGLLEDSEFFGGLSKGELFGEANLRGLPLGAMVAAATGEAPGEGLVTGIANFRLPVADPLAGRATVVAERIRVSTKRSPQPKEEDDELETQNTDNSEEERLLGSGTLDFANRELKNLNIQLSGAGTWDVKGQYTRKKVDLSAKFLGTTFTPILKLIPSLASLDPALKGSINLSATGSYERPRGLLRASDLEGKIAGFSLNVPTVYGDLLDNGTFTGGSEVQTGGSVATDGKLKLSGQLSNGALSKTKLQFRGLLAPKALGALPNSTVTLFQRGEGWAIDARSRSTNPTSGKGYLRAKGQMTPQWNLAVTSRNYNLPINTLYAKETALDANIALKTKGEQLHVSGIGNFKQMILGRVKTPDVLLAPDENITTPKEPTSRNSHFSSPLPEQYTTFPKPKQPEEIEEEKAPATPSFLERLVLQDLRIRAPNGIRIDENLVRAEFSTGGLTVSGTGANPAVSGRIIPTRGSIFLRENEFKITGGNIQFTGQDVYPTFDIIARGTVPSAATKQRVPITLNFQGDFRSQGNQAKVLNLTSTLECADNSNNCTNPETGNIYGEAELYALIATGIPDLNSLPNNLDALGASALQTALNVFMLGEVERTLARALNLDVVKLTPTLSGEKGLNATFTVGSYIARDLFLQYQVDLQGNGLFNATYTTNDGRFTLKASSPFAGLDIDSIRPNFSAAYNLNFSNSLSLGVETKKTGSTFKLGYKNKF